MDRRTLFSYKLPEWAKHITTSPQFKLQLAQLPTPINTWSLPGMPSDIKLCIKRDDMTGSVLTGNKIRKLEFFLAEAIEKKIPNVITYGRMYSNHCRATAAAAAEVGLKAHLVVTGSAKNVGEFSCLGNSLLNRLAGASFYVVPPNTDYQTGVVRRMRSLQERLKSEKGEEAMVIPVGGSNTLGTFGYLNAFEEMIQQGILENFDDIVVACGSGGTTAGLAIGNYLTGSKLRIHAMAVCNSKEHFLGVIQNILSELGLGSVTAADIVNITEHLGEGYSVSAQREIDFILEVAQATGIMLDPVYSGRAAFGLVNELGLHRERFKGNRILFVHTGGMFEMLDGRLESSVLSRAATSNIQFWLDSDKPR